MKALFADIADASTIEDLQNAYFNAIKTVGNDQTAKDAIIKAKDAKKATL